MNHKLTFRKAVPGDEALMLVFIHALADYEKMSDDVVATPELLNEWVFQKERAQVIFAMEGDTPCGMALYFYNFSTFLGRAGIYLEDLFVLPEFRGRGYGKALLKKLSAIAHEEGCGRLEWSCLDWNQPSLDFYKSMGAVGMPEWIIHRLTGDTLTEAAKAE